MAIAQKVFSEWKRRETYMLLIGRMPARTKGRGLIDHDPSGSRVFLLPDQIKRDKGVWWMPWQ